MNRNPRDRLRWRLGACTMVIGLGSCAREPNPTEAQQTSAIPREVVSGDITPVPNDPRLACVRDHPTPPTYEPVVRALCAELFDHSGISASVAIAVDERLVFSTAVGPRCRGQAEPLMPTTVMGIGSTTKVITAALTLAVAERHDVSIDDPIELVEPSLDPPPSLRQLLNHTAGLRDPTPDAMIAAGDRWPALLVKHRVSPGAYHYANAHYLWIGRWLEQTTSVSFADLYARDPSMASVRPLVPMALDSTMTVACGHRAEAAGEWTAIDPTTGGPLPAWTQMAGGGWASAESLVRLPAALRKTGRLPVMVESLVRTDRPGWDYGLGIRARNEGSERVLAHAGDTGTYWAELQWSPSTQVSVAVLSTTPRALKATLHAAFAAGQRAAASRSSSSSPSP